MSKFPLSPHNNVMTTELRHWGTNYSAIINSTKPFNLSLMSKLFKSFFGVDEFVWLYLVVGKNCNKWFYFCK